MDFIIRKAQIDDIDELDFLIEISSKSINSQYYSDAEIKAALESVWMVDDQLIIDKTYFVVENKNGQIIGCGGWSKRKLLFGKSQSKELSNLELNPTIEPARIRAFFVHPEYTRMGIGSKILKHCEFEAKSTGFKSLELVATLSGVKLYSANGFINIKEYKLKFDGGLTNDVVLMRKSLN